MELTTNRLEEDIDRAMKSCQYGKWVHEDGMFDKIYPFTAENIRGYIDLFHLDGKSLLTLGSSSDQVLNALLKGCQDITQLDTNPYTKYYYYLKAACIICLEPAELISVLKTNNYYNTFHRHASIFDRKVFERIRETLQHLDQDSYMFWNSLIHNCKARTIRKNLFVLYDYNKNTVMGCNNYLQSLDAYYDLREKIKQVKITFVNEDLFSNHIDRTFDNIWLSKFVTYLKIGDAKILVDRMSQLLNVDGKLLVSYLYNTRDLKYELRFGDIYDLVAVAKVLETYQLRLQSFVGVGSLATKNDKYQDSVYVYHKH